MHQNQLKKWQHQHFFSTDKKNLEKVTLIVVIITFVMMIAEILFGLLTNSMALLADGWHMGTHAFALGISVIAYMLARKNSTNHRFAFGTWKIEILGAYTSAIILGLLALVMVYTSVNRLLHPLKISYNEAIVVAIIGLVVNLVCMFILNKGSSHTHHTHDDHASHEDANHNHKSHNHIHHDHDDLNLKSAYLHVAADSLTSIFAIIALLGAKYYNLNWLDPFMGIVGAVLIARWAILLLKDSSKILLDHESFPEISEEIKDLIESDKYSKICDLHLLRVSDEKYICIISIVTSRKYSIEHYKKILKKVHELVHITVEINECNTPIKD